LTRIEEIHIFGAIRSNIPVCAVGAPYRENVERLIEEKKKGKKITTVNQPRKAPVIDPMEALTNRNRRCGRRPHRACSTRATVTAALIACQICARSKSVEQRDSRLNQKIKVLAVYVQPNWSIAGPDCDRPTLSLCFLLPNNRIGQSGKASRFEEVSAITSPACR
jgi:transcription elongation factor Elf1